MVRLVPPTPAPTTTGAASPNEPNIRTIPTVVVTKIAKVVLAAHAIIPAGLATTNSHLAGAHVGGDGTVTGNFGGRAVARGDGNATEARVVVLARAAPISLGASLLLGQIAPILRFAVVVISGPDDDAGVLGGLLTDAEFIVAVAKFLVLFVGGLFAYEVGIALVAV